MARAIMFAETGDIDKFHVEQVDVPEPEVGQLRVRVLFAGLNPVDWKLLAAGSTSFLQVELPSGNGNDFSGVIDEIGPGVTEFEVGDLVYGGKRFYAQADYAIVTPDEIHSVPTGLGADVAGTLDIAAKTAVAGIRKIAVAPGDTVFVSAAAGGVGLIAAQLAVRAGATVIGSASEYNHEFLSTLGIIPIEYGEGLAARLGALAPGGIRAAFSTQSVAESQMLLDLGIPASRINSIGAGGAAAKLQIASDGMKDAHPGDLESVAEQISTGEIVYPIDSVYTFEQVQDAYKRLKAGHLRGKIVLRSAPLK